MIINGQQAVVDGDYVKKAIAETKLKNYQFVHKRINVINSMRLKSNVIAGKIVMNVDHLLHVMHTLKSNSVTFNELKETNICKYNINFMCTLNSDSMMGHNQSRKTTKAKSSTVKTKSKSSV